MSEIKFLMVRMEFKDGGFCEVGNFDGDSKISVRASNQGTKTMPKGVLGANLNETGDKMPWLTPSQKRALAGFIDRAQRFIVRTRREGI